MIQFRPHKCLFYISNYSVHLYTHFKFLCPGISSPFFLSFTKRFISKWCFWIFCLSWLSFAQVLTLIRPSLSNFLSEIFSSSIYIVQPKFRESFSFFKCSTTSSRPSILVMTAFGLVSASVSNLHDGSKCLCAYAEINKDFKKATSSSLIHKLYISLSSITVWRWRVLEQDGVLGCL